MRYPEIAKEIIDLKNKDLDYRNRLVYNGKLGDGYDPKMEEIHISNSKRLETIIKSIGFPTIESVGEVAADAAWLIIQHSISRPDFMRSCQEWLESEVEEGNASAIHLAYLTDRILILEGKTQLYGTQFDWDKQGMLSPQRLESWDTVNRRRRELGLNSLEEQIQKLRQNASDENHKPPIDSSLRQKQFDDWLHKVGWRPK